MAFSLPVLHKNHINTNQKKLGSFVKCISLLVSVISVHTTKMLLSLSDTAICGSMDLPAPVLRLMASSKLFALSLLPSRNILYDLRITVLGRVAPYDENVVSIGGYLTIIGNLSYISAYVHFILEGAGQIRACLLISSQK